MKSFMIICLLLSCGAGGLAQDGLGGALQPAADASVVTATTSPKDCLCGDVNCDGVLDAYDGIYILNYLCGGGPAPLTADLEHADWDGYRHLTISDVLMSMLPQLLGSQQCPATNPPLDPSVDTINTAAYLHYTNRVRAGASAAISLAFQSYDVLGFTLPMRVRVDGQIPVVDSVVFTLADDHPISSGCHAVYSDSGFIVLGAQTWFLMQGFDHIATVFLSFPSNPSGRPVTIEWADITPVQAPVPDSSVIPMVVINDYEKQIAYSYHEPVLVPTCCILAGDVNDDGKVNIGDAVYQINYAFLFGPRPPCMAQADANGDGKFNVGDAVFLISYIFRGGPAPICK